MKKDKKKNIIPPLSRSEQQFFQSMFIGVFAGLIVACSGIFASCYIQSCTATNLFIQTGYTFGFSIAIFFVLALLSILINKKKVKRRTK